MQTLQSEIYAHLLELQRLGYLRSGLALEQGDNHLLFLLQVQELLQPDAGMTEKSMTYQTTMPCPDGEVALLTYVYAMQLSPAFLALRSIEVSRYGYTKLFEIKGALPPASILMETVLNILPDTVPAAQ